MSAVLNIRKHFQQPNEEKSDDFEFLRGSFQLPVPVFQHVERQIKPLLENLPDRTEPSHRHAWVKVSDRSAMVALCNRLHFRCSVWVPVEEPHIGSLAILLLFTIWTIWTACGTCLDVIVIYNISKKILGLRASRLTGNSIMTSRDQLTVRVKSAASDDTFMLVVEIEKNEKIVCITSIFYHCGGL